MKILSISKEKTRQLKSETYALYLAYGHPRTPWYAKVFLLLVIGYAVSPIDLIPDFIPILGLCDDLIIVPAGIVLALKMIPGEVIAECREKAKAEHVPGKIKWVGIGIIAFIWLLALSFIAVMIYRILLER